MAYTQHQDQSRQVFARCAVITLSDTRTAQTDSSGDLIRQQLLAAGHIVAESHLITDDPPTLTRLLNNLLSRDGIDAVLSTGGTGISPRDRTIDVIEKMFTQSLPGFGELFRMLSWQQIGSGAMLSRAAAGIASGKIIFAMPGSTSAVQLAMEKLIVPELGHLVGQLRK